MKTHLLIYFVIVNMQVLHHSPGGDAAPSAPRSPPTLGEYCLFMVCVHSCVVWYSMLIRGHCNYPKTVKCMPSVCTLPLGLGGLTKEHNYLFMWEILLCNFINVCNKDTIN